MTTSRFSWITFDVATMMRGDWQEQILEVARNHRSAKVLTPPHHTSREARAVDRLPILTVRGTVVWDRLPWLVELYRGLFKRLYEEATGRRLIVTNDRRYAVVINVQEADGTRYECHVDTNPIEALLYVTDHPGGAGGELVVANDPRAASVPDVDADCTTLHPRSGHLVFFDGRHHPHYVRPLVHGDLRVAVGMNYYLPEFPESTRPPDLNAYLYGER